MKIGLYSIVSPVHDVTSIDETLNDFINDISNEGIDLIDIKIKDFNKTDIFPIIFVKSGGTEGEFKKVYKQMKEPYIILTTGKHNSLAASMEISSFLKQQGKKAEIIHGDIKYIINRIKALSKIFYVKNKIDGLRLGVIGKPSDWLIASDVDYDLAKDILGIELVDISIDELKTEILKKHEIDNEYTKNILKDKFDSEEIKKALYIYSAFKKLIEKYQLSGLTVRCFDLLGDIKSTGCLGLSILNAEGYIAGCEGDIPALISMLIMNYLTDKPVFLANPSRIDTEKNEIVFAHCTLPINMPVNYKLTTHFESGIGAAVKGEIAEGEATIFKFSGNFDQFFVSGARIIENLNETNLCRTQIRLELEESVQYFLKESLGNHHIICNGNFADLIDEFFNWL